MKKLKRGYGLIPDVKDQRDHFIEFDRTLRALPAVYDMRTQCPPIYDQKSLGSCTAQAITSLYEFTSVEQKKRTTRMSRLFHYYNTRSLMGTIQSDSGASIRDTFKAGGKFGFCLESTWPYTISKFKTKPSQQCYTYGVGTIIQDYARVGQDLQSLKRCLAENNPIAFGFAVYESFEGKEIAATGKFTFPLASEKMVGGHAVVLVGYDDGTQCFIVRNSWGSRWGDKGYFYMPYTYVTDPKYSFDFWTLRKVP